MPALIVQPPDPDRQRAEAIAFLRTLQTPSGGFIAAKPADGAQPAPSPRTTRTGLRAVRLLGGSPPDRPAVFAFLKACYDPKSGGFADRPGAKPDPISTSVALMALIELKEPLDPYLERALSFMGERAAGFEDVRMV